MCPWSVIESLIKLAMWHVWHAHILPWYGAIRLIMWHFCDVPIACHGWECLPPSLRYIWLCLHMPTLFHVESAIKVMWHCFDTHSLPLLRVPSTWWWDGVLTWSWPAIIKSAITLIDDVTHCVDMPPGCHDKRVPYYNESTVLLWFGPWFSMRKSGNDYFLFDLNDSLHSSLVSCSTYSFIALFLVPSGMYLTLPWNHYRYLPSIFCLRQDQYIQTRQFL